MDFEGTFQVPGAPADVMRRFMDVERTARCVPGATIEGRTDNGGYKGVMTVAFGPKRIQFRGEVVCHFDEAGWSGQVVAHGLSDLRSAGFRMKSQFHVFGNDGPGGARPSSTVTVSSTAELQGVLADFARTGGQLVAQTLMIQFVERFTADSFDIAPEQQDQAPALGLSQLAVQILWLKMGQLREFFLRGARRMLGGR